jgi:hypothetical protein
LASYKHSAANQKNIRAGAAKVVELVAEKCPELVAPHLEKLMPALSVAEPQTRWMIIRTMGYCAHLNQSVAGKAVPYAEKYIDRKEGLCLAGSTDLFLGDLGSISEKEAHRVFPVLECSMENVIENEQDWILEACNKMLPNLEKAEREIVMKFAERWQYSTRKSTQRRAMKILRRR